MIKTSIEWGGVDPYGLAVITSDEDDDFLILFSDGHQFITFHEVMRVMEFIDEFAFDKLEPIKSALLKWAIDLEAYAREHSLGE